MRIRIRAVPISFRSRFYSRRLCRARRRRWSSRAFCCSRDTCSTFCAIRGPSRAPVRRRTRRRRNVDNLCRAGLWLWRCRSRLYEELPRCDSEKFTIPLIRNLLNRHHRVARNERINLKFFNELLFFFFLFFIKRDMDSMEFKFIPVRATRGSKFLGDHDKKNNSMQSGIGRYWSTIKIQSCRCKASIENWIWSISSSYEIYSKEILYIYFLFFFIKSTTALKVHAF